MQSTYLYFLLVAAVKLKKRVKTHISNAYIKQIPRFRLKKLSKNHKMAQYNSQNESIKSKHTDDLKRFITPCSKLKAVASRLKALAHMLSELNFCIAVTIAIELTD